MAPATDPFAAAAAAEAGAAVSTTTTGDEPDDRHGRQIHVPDYTQPPCWGCAASSLVFPAPDYGWTAKRQRLGIVFRLVPLGTGTVRVMLTMNAWCETLLTLRMNATDAHGLLVGVAIMDAKERAVEIRALDRRPLRVLVWWEQTVLRVVLDEQHAYSHKPQKTIAKPGHVEIDVDGATPACAIADVALYARGARAFERVRAMVHSNRDAVVPDAYYRLDDACGSALRESVGETGRTARHTGPVRWWNARMGLERAPAAARPDKFPAVLDQSEGRRMLGEAPFHDVYLVPERGPGAEPVRAHRMVLAFHSEYLRALFRGGESGAFAPPAPGPDGSAAVVVVPACDAPTLRTLVDVFYGMDYAPRFMDRRRMVADDDALFARWAVSKDDVSPWRRAPRPGEPRYAAMVEELVALAHAADALRVRHLLDVCLFALSKPRMMRSPEQVVALLGALPRPCGSGLAVLRERYVAWLAFRRRRLLTSWRAAWDALGGEDRDEIAREADRLERAYLSPQDRGFPPATAVADPGAAQDGGDRGPQAEDGPRSPAKRIRLADDVP